MSPVREAARRPRRSSVWARRLVIMVKFPAAGRVKTRLGRDVGAIRATQFYRHTAAAVIARLARGRGWHTILSATPDHAKLPISWRRSVDVVNQGSGDLGRRMQRIFDRAPPGPVVIVGTDIPAIGIADIARAFRALGKADAVFGPAADGGYWLVGLRRTPRVIAPFEGVRWSTQHALADTEANVRDRAVVRVATLSDVDSGDDLAAEQGRHGRIVRPLLP